MYGDARQLRAGGQDRGPRYAPPARRAVGTGARRIHTARDRDLRYGTTGAGHHRRHHRRRRRTIASRRQYAVTNRLRPIDPPASHRSVGISEYHNTYSRSPPAKRLEHPFPPRTSNSFFFVFFFMNPRDP